jgi:glycosyltransferase involved in cell wall biosynthesis
MVGSLDSLVLPGKLPAVRFDLLQSMLQTTWIKYGKTNQFVSRVENNFPLPVRYGNGVKASMSAGPLVSVVTPVYNGDKFLDQCIQGVLKQTFTDFEYVIVDNASTDKTAEIIDHYRQQDSRLRVFRNESTIPVIQNLNKCIEYIAPGSKWIKYALADDILFPYCIQEMLRLGEQDPAIGMVSAYRIYGNRLAYLGLPMDQQIFDGPEILRKQVLHEFHVCSGSPNSLMYRRRVFEELGGYKDGYLHADTELAYRLLDNYKLAFVHDVLTWTGHHEGRVEVASIKAGRNITEYLDFGYKQLGNYKNLELSEQELSRLAEYYANRLVEFRIKRLGDLDLALPEGMAALVPAEVSSRYAAAMRKNWRRYVRLLLSAVKHALFNRS